jgi:Flp pilus assembly protein TadG
MNKINQIHPRQNGQSLVEMGLFMLVLLWLLAGAVDFGIGFFSYVAIRDAAQEGALYGSIVYDTVYDEDHPEYTLVNNLISLITDRVENTSSGPVDLKSASVQTEVIPPSAWCAGYQLAVNVNYDYPISMPLIGIITGPTINLRSSATSTLLVPPCSSP